MVTETVPRPPHIVARLRKTFEAGRTRDLVWRRGQLEALRRLVLEGEPRLIATLQADFFQACLRDAGYRNAQCRVGNRPCVAAAWALDARAARRRSMGAVAGLRAHRARTARGGARHRAVELPGAASARAAGRRARRRQLRGAQAVRARAGARPALLAELLPQYLDPDAVAVVEGGVPETTALLAQRFDHIFFTGGGARRPRSSWQAAAQAPDAGHPRARRQEPGDRRSPTPTSTSPPRRIVWGKFLNAGQTCIAPDYVLVERARRRRAASTRLSAAVNALLRRRPAASPDFGRIVNEQHSRQARRLSRRAAAVAVGGGGRSSTQRYVAPTVLVDVEPGRAGDARGDLRADAAGARASTTLDEAIAFVNARDKPLALYVFTRRRGRAREVVARHQLGRRRGQRRVSTQRARAAVRRRREGGLWPLSRRAGFETFSNMKGVLMRQPAAGPSLRTDPHSEAKLRWIDRLM